MREGWTYKKLGEVAKISSGKAIPSSDIVDTFSEGLYPCYGGNGLRGYVSHYSNDGFVPVIGRVGALCGNVHLPQEKFYATEHALVVMLKTNDKPQFIEYLLSYLNLRQYAKGVAQPVLSASTLSEILIPVPPLSEQQRIVSELDLLSSIIEKKKAQLKEYDQLAQSIFYDMFGDPVTNEKGWEVVKLGELTEVGTGSTPDRKNESYYLGNNPWIKSTEVCNCAIYDVQEHISDDALKDTNCTLYPENTILIAMYGQGKTRGQVAIMKLEACTNQAVAAILPSSKIEPMFLYQHLHLMYEHIRSLARGGNQSNLNLFLVKSIKIMVPPLHLQQSFASKIEAIERQKALIQQSIAEVQMLFDSRMDDWFA